MLRTSHQGPREITNGRCDGSSDIIGVSHQVGGGLYRENPLDVASLLLQLRQERRPAIWKAKIRLVPVAQLQKWFYRAKSRYQRGKQPERLSIGSCQLRNVIEDKVDRVGVVRVGGEGQFEVFSNDNEGIHLCGFCTWRVDQVVLPSAGVNLKTHCDATPGVHRHQSDPQLSGKRKLGHTKALATDRQRLFSRSDSLEHRIWNEGRVKRNSRKQDNVSEQIIRRARRVIGREDEEGV